MFDTKLASTVMPNMQILTVIIGDAGRCLFRLGEAEFLTFSDDKIN